MSQSKKNNLLGNNDVQIRLDVDGENDWNHRKDFFTSRIQFYEPDIFGSRLHWQVENDNREVSIEKPFGPSVTFNNFVRNEPVTKLIGYVLFPRTVFLK